MDVEGEKNLNKVLGYITPRIAVEKEVMRRFVEKWRVSGSAEDQLAFFQREIDRTNALFEEIGYTPPAANQLKSDTI